MNKSVPTKKSKNPDIFTRIYNHKPQTLFLVSISILIVSVVMLGIALLVEHNTVYLTPVNGHPNSVKVSAGYTAMRVNSVSTAQGTGIFKAPDTQQYIIVSVTIRNISSKPINVFPSTDIYLKDPNGNITYLGIYDLEHPFRAGEILPGDQVTGQLSYIVNKNVPQKLYMDGIWSGGVVVFDVPA